MSSRDAQQWISGKHPRRLQVQNDIERNCISILITVPMCEVFGCDWFSHELFTWPDWRNRVGQTIRMIYNQVKEHKQ